MHHRVKAAIMAKRIPHPVCDVDSDVFGLSGVALFWLDKALEAGWNLDGQTGVLCVNLVFLQLGVVWATWWLIRDHGMSWQQAFGLSVSNPARICRFALQALC